MRGIALLRERVGRFLPGGREAAAPPPAAPVRSITGKPTRRAGGRPRKTLADLIRDGTFSARHHESRLASAEELPLPELERYRRRYRAARTPEQRREIALELERIVREEAGRADLLLGGRGDQRDDPQPFAWG